jgi:hypothetical protein
LLFGPKMGVPAKSIREMLEKLVPHTELVLEEWFPDALIWIAGDYIYVGDLESGKSIIRLESFRQGNRICVSAGVAEAGRHRVNCHALRDASPRPIRPSEYWRPLAPGQILADPASLFGPFPALTKVLVLYG